MHLLDTVVVSEMRKRRPDRHVVAWMGSILPVDLFISVITVSEIERGIERQRHANPIFAGELSRWLELVLRSYSERILPVTVGIARRWGRLAVQIGHPNLDLAIAATALEHGLIVVTRNVTDFTPTGVATLNPFLPQSPRKR